MADVSRLLIVRQRPVGHAEMDQLVDQLHGEFGLDPYLARQHLLGPGLAQLAQGEPQTLAGLAGVLRRHGYPCWVIVPPRPAFAPPRLRSLVISPAGVEFDCEGGRTVLLERGVAAVGILADLSGELPSRQAKRLLAQNAYLGRGQAAVFTPAEMREAILKAQPVFDCYLLDTGGAVTAAFRVLPGRFNPEGLGGRASLGAVHNLEAVLDLVGEYAGTFRLYTDFGFGQLPGCQLQSAGEHPQALLDNLDALTCYGWLVASLSEPGREDGNPFKMPGMVLAVGGSGAAAMAGMPAACAAVTTVAAAGAETDRAEPEPAAAPVKPPPLPPPPARPEPQPSLRRALPVVAAFAGGVLLAVAGQSERWHPLLRGVLHSGVATSLLAAALCWGAFACLRLKRRIEDTPTSRIRSLAMGLVEVHGRAQRRFALVTPMTHSACAWYRLRKYRRDRNNRWTLTSESDSNHVPFALDDGSGGQVVIDPAGATFRVRTQQTGYPGESALIGAAVDGGPDEKWVEDLIFEGTSLYVLGYARPAREAGAGLRARTIAALRRVKLDPRAQRRYDTDGDGRLDAGEWQVARDEAERFAAAEHLATGGQSGPGQVLIGKPPRGLPFLVAEAQSGAELARRYGWGGAVLLLLGAAATVAAVLQCHEHFGQVLGR